MIGTMQTPVAQAPVAQVPHNIFAQRAGVAVPAQPGAALPGASGVQGVQPPMQRMIPQATATPAMPARSLAMTQAQQPPQAQSTLQNTLQNTLRQRMGIF